MSITINTQELELDGVTTINVSDIELDPTTNQFVRNIDFYLDPTTNTNRVPTLRVKVTAPTSQSVVITIPSGVTFILAFLICASSVVDWLPVLSA
jgi:hypothetical protein